MPGVVQNWDAAKAMTIEFIAKNGKSGVAKSAEEKAATKATVANAKAAKQDLHQAMLQRHAEASAQRKIKEDQRNIKAKCAMNSQSFKSGAGGSGYQNPDVEVTDHWMHPGGHQNVYIYNRFVL